ncbi:MAG: hypothetical protein HRU70_05530 [Phycisphaeraceae bacterium]|nr:MAG: hypothetical protein HRU70_05530 [Phycisphaeraceae bacterium]
MPSRTWASWSVITVAAFAPPAWAEPPKYDLRARAWAALAAIHERALESAEWEDRVEESVADHGPFEVLRSRARAGPFGEIRVEGVRRYRAGPPGPEVVEAPLLSACIEGVAQWHRARDHSAVIGPEQRLHLEPYMFPGLLTGLGRSLDQSLRDRYDLLMLGRTLIIAEETPERVVLEGHARLGRRSFDHRVILDPADALPRAHQFLSPVWGHTFADWSVLERQTIVGLTIPKVVSYTIASPGIAQSDLDALNRRMLDIGMSGGVPGLDDPSFPEWVRLRREHFAATGGAPPLTNLTRQTATVRVVSLNPTFTGADFDPAPPVPPRTIMSTAFGGRLRAPSIDPADAVPTPAAAEPDPKETQ